MNRRQVIQSLGLISSHAVFPSVLSSFLASCQAKEHSDYNPEFFTTDELNTIIETIDVIIPETKTKSASQVGSHKFLDQVFSKCLNADQQKVIKEGVARLSSELSLADDKQKYLMEVDKKAYSNDASSVYFKTIKQYALVGFFTSQEGTTKASNYVKVPEAYKGEIPQDENTLNYGKTNLHYYI
jgi:hypothetical protein